MLQLFGSPWVVSPLAQLFGNPWIWLTPCGPGGWVTQGFPKSGVYDTFWDEKEGEI